METILVQVNDDEAYKVLEDLQDRHLIKLLNKNDQPKTRLSDKYAGKLPPEIADELQAYVTQSRNEWNSHDI